MGIESDSRAIADRTLAKIVENESLQLRAALGAGNYPEVKKWARALGKTLKIIRAELGARA